MTKKDKTKNGLPILYLLFFFCAILLKPCFCAETASNTQPTQQRQQGFIGEFFDTKVPIGNYYFIKSVLMVFGKDGRKVDDKPKELETAIWDELLLSYEAFRRGINVSDEETEQGVSSILSSAGAGFNWKQDPTAFKNWLSEKVGEPQELFFNQIKHNLQVQKLRQQVMQEIEPKVSDKEALEAFLDENTSLGIELVEFPKQADAEDFYRQAKAKKSFWEEEKAKQPKKFRQIGTVSVAFLIDLWKIPREACFKMVNMSSQEIFEPRPIYRGHAVFKVTGSRKADKSKFAQAKPGYYEKVKSIKKYQGVNEWFDNLKKQAKIKIYPSSAESQPQNKNS